VRVSICEFRNVGQNIGCADDELRMINEWADLFQFLARISESREAPADLRWLLIWIRRDASLTDTLPLTQHRTARPQETSESAGHAREEVNKPRNQPRRGGATYLPCLIGLEAGGTGQLIWRSGDARQVRWRQIVLQLGPPAWNRTDGWMMTQSSVLVSIFLRNLKSR